MLALMLEPPAASEPVLGRTSSRRRALLPPACLMLAMGFCGAMAVKILGEDASAQSSRAVHRRLGRANNTEPAPSALSLVALVTGSDECDTWLDSYYTVPVLFALVLYTFVGLAIVCDEYFCESLEKISTALKLSDDVAGATFMAAGSSAPELFTAIITIFIAPGDQGVGTIVGSAVFNICVIVGITALCAGQVLDLWWYPLTRDSAFYALSILLMMWAMYDGQVTVTESSTLVATYFLYVTAMMFNEQVVDYLKREEHRRSSERSIKEIELSANPFAKLNPLLTPTFRPAHFRSTSVRRKVEIEQVQRMLITAVVVNRAKSKLMERISSRQAPASMSEAQLEEPEELSCFERLVEKISLPLTLSMQYTIPDCRQERWGNWFFLTFTMSILWIGLLSFLMVDFASRAGCILQVPEFLMGLTVLAAGTSVPDALSSILVARNGQGNMAVCNVLGSNVFNILLGLGAPWLFAALLQGGAPFATGSGSILEPIAILFGYLVGFYLALVLFKWKLTPTLGVALLFMQTLYWGWNIGRYYA